MAIIILIFCFSSLLSYGQNASIEYYRNFDLIHMSCYDKLSRPKDLPYIRVHKIDSSIDKIEIFFKNKRKPIKVFIKIQYDGFDKCYVSESRFLDCKSIDTLISVNDILYEYRNCYSKIDGQVNSQDVLYYENVSNNSIRLNHVFLFNLYAHRNDRMNANADQKAIANILPRSNIKKNSFIITNENRIAPQGDGNTIPILKLGLFWSIFNLNLWRFENK